MDDFIIKLNEKINLETFGYAFLFGGAILSVIASVVLGKLNSIESKQLKNAAIDLKIKTDSISTATDTIFKTQQLLTNLNTELTNRQKELNNLTESLLENEKELSAITGELKSASLTEFEKNSTTGKIDGFKINPNKKLFIKLGGINSNFEVKDFKSQMTIINDPSVFFELIDNELLFTATIYDFQGNVIFDIKRNLWLSSNGVLHKNWDNKGFEVIDNKKTVLLKIDVKEENTIHISGIFLSPRNSFLVSDSIARVVSLNSKDFLESYYETISETKPIFKHHGKNIFKQRL